MLIIVEDNIIITPTHNKFLLILLLASELGDCSS